MCPFCLASAALMVAGATSTGGLAAVVIHKFRVKKSAEAKAQNKDERRIGHESDRASENRNAS